VQPNHQRSCRPPDVYWQAKRTQLPSLFCSSNVQTSGIHLLRGARCMQQKSVRGRAAHNKTIELEADRDVKFWTRELAVSEERLRLMVRMFGNSPALIRALSKGRGPSASGRSSSDTTTSFSGSRMGRRAS
jgi:hypothetical protein